jgi:hypothetical protein
MTCKQLFKHFSEVPFLEVTSPAVIQSCYGQAKPQKDQNRAN